MIFRVLPYYYKLTAPSIQTVRGIVGKFEYLKSESPQSPAKL